MSWLAFVFSLHLGFCFEALALGPVPFKRTIPSTDQSHNFFHHVTTKATGTSFMQCAAKAAWNSKLHKTAFKYNQLTKRCDIGTYPNDYDRIMDNYFGNVTEDDTEAIYICKECREQAEPPILLVSGGLSTSPTFQVPEYLDVLGANKTCLVPTTPAPSGYPVFIDINDQLVHCIYDPVNCVVYDRAANSWQPYANHPDVRNFASILKMSNSEVLILGGIYAGSKITHSTSLRLKDQTFTAGPDLYKERSAACVSYINPKQAIIGGGARYTTTQWVDESDEVYTFDMDTERFTKMPQGLSVARFQLSCGYTQDSQGEREIYFVGGITRSVGYHALKVVDIYSTATKTWRTPPELPFKLMGVFSVQHLDTFFLGSGSNDVGGNAIYRNVWDIRHDQVQVVGSIQVAGKFRAGFLVPLYYLQCN